MGTRIKLRVCTWNVGNAQPPTDLKEWLGIGTHDYDIIAIGAQEANFGSDKSTVPGNVVSPTNLMTNTEGMGFSPMSPCTPTTPATGGSSRCFRKLGKVLGGLSRTSSSRKLKKDETNENVEIDVDVPRSSTSFPLRSNVGKPEEVERTKSDDVGDMKYNENRDVPVMSLVKFTKNGSSQFENVDESLLIKRRGNSADEETKPISLEDPLGEIFVSGGWLNEDCDKDRDGLVLQGLKDICVEDNGLSTTGFGTPGRRRSRKGRKSAQSGARASRSGEDTEKLNDEDGGLGHGSVSSGVKKFSQVVEKNIPNEYHLIAKHHLMEIKLLLFIHERHRNRVTKTEAVTEATGIGNVVGNKGAVAVKLTLDDTTFCFVCCHLAAHEGAKFLAQRNDDVIDIMRNIERDKIYGLPVIHQFDHIFWMGDLNYRLDLKHTLPAATTWGHEEKFAYVLNLVSCGRYEDLTVFDELRREMGLGHVFAGFTEGKLCFAPTFKVTRGKLREYQDLRVPSYCDRILWHSLPLHRNHVKLCEYGSVEGIDTSDHKPVYGIFQLVIPNGVKLYPMPAPRDCLKCTMDFIKLRVSGLYESAMSPRQSNDASHTRRVVTATFDGNGMFLKDKTLKMEVPLRAGKRECVYEELPAIAIRPVGSLNDLTYKYVTMVFARLGSRQGTSCVLPFAKMVQMPGRHRVNTELELTKYGRPIAKVVVMVELVVSLETWIDTRNNIVKARR